MPALPFVFDLLGWNGSNPNVADTSSTTSRAIAGALLNSLGIGHQVEHVGQKAGRELEEAVAAYLTTSLPERLNGRTTEVNRRTVVSDFAQYEHLAELDHLIAADVTGTLRASIGTDYQVKPDVTVGLRDEIDGRHYLHAAVPCKWTLRSDRAQNVRHEAVVLIRHRRGRLPHIAAVTAEPMPSRLASLARGTAEVDALYHVALDELTDAVRLAGTPEQVRVLTELIVHRRLFDLSDLPKTLTL